MTKSSVLELYGKCRELGYCDCGGFLGCYDPLPPAPKPVIENELEAARRGARRDLSPNENDIAREAENLERRGHIETKCPVCKKALRSNHNCKGAPELKIPKICGHCLKPSRKNHRCKAQETSENAAVERLLEPEEILPAGAPIPKPDFSLRKPPSQLEVDAAARDTPEEEAAAEVLEVLHHAPPRPLSARRVRRMERQDTEIIEVPSGHEIIIKLAGAEIHIRPVREEPTNG